VSQFQIALDLIGTEITALEAERKCLLDEVADRQREIDGLRVALGALEARAMRRAPPLLQAAS